MKIAVVGIGYVGMAIATFLSQTEEVVAVDIIKEKIDLVNNKKSPIKDDYVEDFLKSKNLNLKATDNYDEAFTDAKYIIICTPTNYDEKTKELNTESVEKIIQKTIDMNIDSSIVIKSTIPIGFTENMKKKYHKENIFFCPEFLREGKALYDILYPSRIIIGDKNDYAKEFAEVLVKNTIKKDIKVMYTNSNEAEAIKLFSNTYLAMKVAFFNELDTYSEQNNMNTKEIIEGVVADDRIGESCSNPSFGYGGYCLPKDSKQLLKAYNNIPQKLIEAIVDSNTIRKKYIASEINKMEIKTLGIYRLQSKKDADNIRESAIRDIISYLNDSKFNIIIYEPILKNQEVLDGCKIENDFEKFINMSDVIIANRYDDKIMKYKEKIYSRDIYQRD